MLNVTKAKVSLLFPALQRTLFLGGALAPFAVHSARAVVEFDLTATGAEFRQYYPTYLANSYFPLSVRCAPPRRHRNTGRV
jgi:hypothetical protein